ncbi:squalene epoxidase [Dichotomopilus funicola]|uniref:Squalene monooxygenase n=1 Tax=Dichotomopilus funicola TaxID=1934379 RepID=A0AAN6UWF9_9PEZI|nr:squalene epoxidase [Dichotomopilus funicola]
MNSTYDVLIIGAGIAGCAIATGLAKQGRRVVVLERSLREPDRIAGEILQPGGIAALSKLGLDDCVEGIGATPMEGYHFHWTGEQASFWFCPLSSGDGGPAVKPTGRSFHHGKFVTKLRAAVAREPNVTLLQATAVELLRDERTGGIVGAVGSREGGSSTEYRASLTILSDGSASNFRAQFTHLRPQSHSRFWGLELEASLPKPNYAHGILGHGLPIFMYQIGPHKIRMFIDIPNTAYRRLGSTDAVRAYLRERVIPTVPACMQASLTKAIETGRLRSMPNSWLPSTRTKAPGLIMLGDSANMRHPATGAGMTVALKDAVLLTELLDPSRVASLGDTNAVTNAVGKFHWKRKRHSAPLNIVAEGMYAVFVADDTTSAVIQHGLIRYIQGGEENFAMPGWLMGGVVESPLLLLYHFFKVAIYSNKLRLCESTWVGLPVVIFQSLLTICAAVSMIWRPVIGELQL